MADARFMLEGERWRGAAFFAQQAAEKAMKAVLVGSEGRFVKTHDLVLLAEEVKAPEKVRRACEELSPAYVSFRYPDVEEPLDPEEASNLVQQAEEVLRWARTRIS